MGLTLAQGISIVTTIESAVQAGLMVFNDVIAFVQSKGADASQLIANRAVLAGDVAVLSAELAADTGTTTVTTVTTTTQPPLTT